MEMSRMLVVFAWLAGTLLLTSTVGQNIDTRFPVVFELPVRVPGAVHFGHSVLIQRSADGREPPMFLVGAPNLTEPALGLNTGAVFGCQWPKHGSTRCANLNMTRRLPEANLPGGSIFTNYMQLGWNLAPHPQLAGFLTCAFAWSNPLWVQPQWWTNPNGQCLYLGPAPNYRATVIRPMSRGEPFTRDGRYLNAYGMAGMAASFSADGQRLYLGAPGFLDWRGGLAVVDLAPHLAIGDPIIDQADLVPDPNSANSTDLYLGYSVTRGTYFLDQEHVVVAAPRQNLLGSVLFFREPVVPGAQPGLVLRGLQIGEYYGYSLLTMDVNQDGADDLLVGAPMYSSYRKGFSDEGRVFVYLSDGAMTMKPSVTLLGDSKPSARFGTAMVDLGDINLDRFPDAAIGAPYEDDFRGSVYVYRGSGTGFAARYAQKISASEQLASIDLRGFGISFSAPVDVDGNRFADLLIGSHLSDKAVLLRSRPIIRIEPSIRLSDDLIDLHEPCRWSDEHVAAAVPGYLPACLRLRYCFSITSPFDVNWPGGLILSASLRLDPDQKRAFVVHQVAGQPPATRQYLLSQLLTQDYSLVPPDTQYCSDYTRIYMRNPKAIENLIDPVRFELDYALHTVDRSGSVFAVPVLDGPEDTNITTEVFIKMCGRTAKDCLSKLQLDPVFLFDGHQPASTPSIGQQLLVQGLHRSVTLLARVANRAEPAFDVQLRVEIEGLVLLLQLDPKCQQATTEPAGRHQFVCRLEQPFWQGQAKPVNLTFKAFERDVRFSMRLNASNRLDSHSITHYETSFRVVKHAQIEIQIPEPEQSWKFAMNESKHNLQANILLHERGPSSVELAQLWVTYPRTVNQKQLISQLELHQVAGARAFDCTEPINIAGPGTGPGRNRNSSLVMLDCSNPTDLQLVCAQVRCQYVPDPARNTTFARFTAVIDLLQAQRQLFPFANLTVVVQVQAELLDPLLATDAASARGQIQFHLIPVHGQKPSPVLYILLAVLLALVLLAIIIGCFAKLGFFKRHRNPETTD